MGSLVTGDSFMIGFESRVLERLSRTQARVGRGSPLCETHDCVKDIYTFANDCILSLFTFYMVSQLYSKMDVCRYLNVGINRISWHTFVPYVDTTLRVH